MQLGVAFNVLLYILTCWNPMSGVVGVFASLTHEYSGLRWMVGQGNQCHTGMGDGTSRMWFWSNAVTGVRVCRNTVVVNFIPISVTVHLGCGFGVNLWNMAGVVGALASFTGDTPSWVALLGKGKLTFNSQLHKHFAPPLYFCYGEETLLDGV